MSEQTPLLAGEKLAKMHDLLRQCGYDFNEVHPECYRNFSYVKLYELLHNTRPPSQPGRVEMAELRKQIIKIIEDNMLDAWNDICSDTNFHPLDIRQLGGRKLEFHSAHWSQFTAEGSAEAILPLLTNGTVPGAVTGEPVYCTRDGADFCNAVSDKARCSICPAFPSRNSTDE